MEFKDKKYLDRHPYSIAEGKNGWWSTYLPSVDGKRKKIVKHTREEIESIVIDYWKKDDMNPTLLELFTEWNSERLLDEIISRRSYDRYDQVFKRHFAGIADKGIKNTTIDSVILFLKMEKREKDLKKKSFNLLKTVVVGIIETADDKDLLPYSYLQFQNELRKLMRKMKFQKTSCDDEAEVFSEEEYAKITAYLRDNLDTKNTALLLMFVTGMRIGELVALKHSAVYDDYIKICRSETRYKDGDGYKYEIQEHPKTENGFRDVVLPEQYSFLFKRLRMLNPFGEYLFVDGKGNRYTVNAISRRLTTVCKKLGIAPKSPHKVRKTVGTIYFDAKLDRKLILNQMGWSSEAVGENHYHRNRKSTEKKIGIISSIPEFSI